jgi:hypothetical protein
VIFLVVDKLFFLFKTIAIGTTITVMTKTVTEMPIITDSNLFLRINPILNIPILLLHLKQSTSDLYFAIDEDSGSTLIFAPIV